MTLEELFYMSQTIAGFAIVGSLLFVGLEVHHGNRESRHRTIEEVLQNYRAVRITLTDDIDVTRLWISGLHDLAALDPVDKVRFQLITHNIFNTWESLFLLYRDGRMTREYYEPQDKNMSDFLAYPGLQSAWAVRKTYFHKDFRTMVDAKIASIPSSGIVLPYERAERA